MIRNEGGSQCWTDRFEEGHCQAITGVALGVQYSSLRLTTRQAQSELVEEALATGRADATRGPTVAHKVERQC